MNQILSWGISILILLLVIVVIRKKDEEESYYGLKIIGYYLLGSFRFSFNGFSLPLGFAFFLLFMRNPLKNKRSKYYAVCIGLLAFMLTIIVPSIKEAYYERPRYVDMVTTNIYEMDFQNHWEDVRQVLGLDDIKSRSAKVENLDVEYMKDGEMDGLRYEITWPVNHQFHHANIRYHKRKEKYEIRITEVDQWLQYNRLTTGERLFEMLQTLDIEALRPEEECPYYTLHFEGRERLSTNIGKIFIIQNSEIIPYTSESTIEGNLLMSYGMKQTGKSSYTSDYNRYYLFDVMIEE